VTGTACDDGIQAPSNTYLLQASLVAEQSQ
jgi:hypothetical protein